MIENEKKEQSKDGGNFVEDKLREFDENGITAFNMEDMDDPGQLHELLFQIMGD